MTTPLTIDNQTPDFGSERRVPEPWNEAPNGQCCAAATGRHAGPRHIYAFMPH